MKHTSERFATVQLIVEEARDAGVDVRKTVLQKLVYLYEALEGGLGYGVRLHYYGPYMDDLAADMSHMRSLGMLRVDDDPDGWGAHISVDDTSVRMDKARAPDAPDRVKDLLSTFGHTRDELEVAATVHFVWKEQWKRGQTPPSLRDNVAAVRRLKPKFGAEFIEAQADRLAKNGSCKFARSCDTAKAPVDPTARAG